MMNKEQWESLDSEREIKFSCNNQVISIRPKDIATVPLFCPVCEFRMKDADDFVAYKQFSCCRNCELKFARTHVEWLESGWRPDKNSEIWREYIKIRELTSQSKIKFV